MPTNNADLCSVHAALAVEERQLFRPTLRDVAIVRIQAVDKLLQLKLADVWSKRSHQGNRMTTKPAATRTSSEHVIPAPPPAPPVFCRCVIFDTTFWYSFVRSLNRVRGMVTTAPPPDCVGLHTPMLWWEGKMPREKAALRPNHLPLCAKGDLHAFPPKGYIILGLVSDMKK